MNSPSIKLEAVYYSAHVPRSKAALTLLALVFDTLHFPNVYLPREFDADAVRKEADRIESISKDSALLIGTLRMLPHLESLREFCTFAADEDQMFGGDLKATEPIVEAMDEAIFGKRPPGHGLIHSHGARKGLPGGGHIDFPEPFYYQSNALLYSAKRGIPIVNDLPGLPVFAVGHPTDKVQQLASVVALKCVELAFPNVPPLTPIQIVELRDKLSPYLPAFRNAVLRLTARLAEMISVNADVAEIEEQADLLVRTELAASLNELKTKVGSPVKNFRSLGWEVASKGLSVVSAFSLAPAAGWVAAFMAAGALFQKAKDDGPAKSDLYYLVKAQGETRRA